MEFMKIGKPHMIISKGRADFFLHWWWWWWEPVVDYLGLSDA
jgi:hypothetical protein